MKNNVFKIASLSLGLILFAVTLYLYRPVQNRSSRITVVGDAQTKIAPDTAIVTFSVVTQGKQALDAQQENAKKSEAVKMAVEAVTPNAKTEIKTGGYSLSPEQDYYSGKMPKILGYEARNTLTVSLGDLNRVGAVIDAATGAGANSVEGISFVIGENSPAQGDALALAAGQAMTKAEAIARSLNGRIVRVVETLESGAPYLASSSGDAYKMMTNMTTTMNTASVRLNYDTPVQAGSLDVRANVVLVVEIEI